MELALTNATFLGHIRKYEEGTVYERMAKKVLIIAYKLHCRFLKIARHKL